jgi:carboxymethylenebutenolidase
MTGAAALAQAAAGARHFRRQPFMDDRILSIYDHYVHSAEPRRVFLKKLAKAAGGIAAAATILPWLEGTGAEAAMIAADDARLSTATVKYAGGTAEMLAYVAMPRAGAKLPTVVVIHENRGLTDHIRDVARRLAAEGFLAVAPDMLSVVGGTPKDRDKARDMIGDLKDGDVVKNLIATAAFARADANSNGNVGAVGFCWGGQRTNLLAVADPGLKAAVAYYGRQPTADIDKIRAKLMLHYADDDKGVNRGIDAYVKALTAAGKSFEKHQYPGTKHAFNNDANPARYNAAAAKEAWGRTVTFLKANL